MGCMGIQVSWCRLEVELGSPKALHAGHPCVINKEAPPLIVAALSLKTHVPVQVPTGKLLGLSERKSHAKAQNSIYTCTDRCIMPCIPFPGHAHLHTLAYVLPMAH